MHVHRPDRAPSLPLPARVFKLPDPAARRPRSPDRQTAPRGGNALVTKRDHMRGESILNVTLKPLENNPKNLGTTGT